MENNPKRKKRNTKGKKIARIAGRVGAVIGTTLAALVIGLYGMLWICCHGPSESARDLFVGTFLETGALKFVPSLYFSKEEIKEITGNNSRKHTDAEVDPGLIVIPDDNKGDDNKPDDETGHKDNFDENGVEIVEIAGLTYSGKLMIVKDPSKVSVATIYPWSDDNKSKYGVTLDELVSGAGAIAGINGGEYYSDGNWGGKPKGLVVSNGVIQYNAPQYGDVMVGFNSDNILVIKDLTGMSADQVAAMVSEEKIRDAVSFKDVDDGDDNHFTKLIINGEPIQFTGSGSGANPRTVIGQRKDGAVLMFVTDGRGHEGHVGATAADLISVLQQYGAVNAANLDGGSSSSMYYDGEWEMNSVTLYYATSSWRLPTGFVVK
ncbi:MAG: phosphodiester glycosidase family protein [Butyrivibrio sp.]